MKKLSDICFIIQSRLNSKRLPNKMLKPFANTTLFEIAIKKYIESTLIPNENIYLSLYDEELITVAKKYPVNIFNRSERSVSETKLPSEVSEWALQLPYKYFVSMNACTPLLSISTIDNFVNHFLSSPHKSLFAVVEHKNFYWNSNYEMITKYPDSLDTKLVESTYTAAHVLYAGLNSDISKNIYLGDFTKNYPELFFVDKREIFDIDHEWEFKLTELLYLNKERFL